MTGFRRIGKTSRRTRVDSDWKAAMGVDDWFEGIGATTFSLMRARMELHDADKKLFEKTLEKAVAAGVFKGKLTAIIDSSPVDGAGNVADTFELVRKLAGRLARAMGGQLDAGLAAQALQAAAVKPDIDWQDPVARRAELESLVVLALQVLDAAEASDVKGDTAVVEAADLLARVVDQGGRRGPPRGPPRCRPRPGSQPFRPGDAPRPQVGVAAIRRPQNVMPISALHF
jgi:hypothetical protein